MPKPTSFVTSTRRPGSRGSASSSASRSRARGALASSILGNTDVFPPLSVVKKLEPNSISPKGTRLRERIWTEFKSA